MHYQDRVFLPLELRTMEWERNLGRLNRSTLKEFEIPPYLNFFRAAEREYSWTRLGKPIAYVYNKFMRIASRDAPPMSFFSKALLLSLLGKLSDRYVASRFKFQRRLNWFHRLFESVICD